MNGLNEPIESMAELEKLVTKLLNITQSYEDQDAKEKAAMRACGLIVEHGLMIWDAPAAPAAEKVKPAKMTDGLIELANKYTCACDCGATIPPGVVVAWLAGIGCVYADHITCRSQLLRRSRVRKKNKRWQNPKDHRERVFNNHKR